MMIDVNDTLVCYGNVYAGGNVLDVDGYNYVAFLDLLELNKFLDFILSTT
jgi:hypothetical protein